MLPQRTWQCSETLRRFADTSGSLADVKKPAIGRMPAFTKWTQGFKLKLVFVTLTAAALGVVLVSAANGAYGASLSERGPLVRLADAAPEAFGCDEFLVPDPEHARPIAREAVFGSAFAPPVGPPPPFGPPSPLMLASRLAALETFIGIKSEQMDIWRAYTDAVQTVLRPPEPPDETPSAPPDALRQSEMLARDADQRGQQSLRLAVAVGELRSKLSPEQLQRLGAAGPLLPLPPQAGRGMPHVHGPTGPGAKDAGRTTPP